MPTMPTLTRAANSRAAWPLRVKMATPLPYWCLLGSASASSKCLGAHHLQHGAEDLLLVAFHVGRHMIEQRRADEKAVLMPLQREAAPVDDQFGPFIGAGLDPAFNIRLVLRR
jgi:hypothetical protein